MVYSTRRFISCLTLCYFVLVFFSPFSIAITSLGEERANLGAFRTMVRFVLVWICLFPLLLGVWEGMRFVIVALPRLFSYLFLAEKISCSAELSKKRTFITSGPGSCWFSTLLYVSFRRLCTYLVFIVSSLVC